MQHDTFEIRLIEGGAFASVLSLCLVINPSMPAEEMMVSLAEMHDQGYRCIVAVYRGQFVGILGIWIQTKFYVGKHVEYDNFYVKPGYRGRGIGTKLLEYAEQYAISRGCVAAELSCDVVEERSREFWEKQRFTTVGYRYRKQFAVSPT